MTDTAQCPFCELKFVARWELKLHLESGDLEVVKARDQAT